MEFELSSNNAGWRQMSFPLSGDFSNLNGLTLNLSSAPINEQNVFYWNNLADATVPANNAGWMSPGAASDQSRAYSIYLDAGFFSFANPITYEGEYNPGDKIYPLTYLNDPGNGILSGQPGYENGVGWNFIPNLFPSLLNTADMTADNALQYKNIHIWDANIQQYKAFTNNPGTNAVIIPYNNQGTDLAELAAAGGISPFQGFWVKTTDATETSFTLKNDWRGVSFSNLNPHQSLKTKNSFQLNVFSEKDSTWDGAVNAFESEASVEFENNEDVYKLISPSDVPSLFFETASTFVSVNTVPNEEQVLRLNFKPQPNNQNGLYYIHLNNDFTKASTKIYLEDLSLNRFFNLKEADYVFRSQEGESSDRFKIHYFKTPPSQFNPEIASVNVYQNETEIIIEPTQSLGSSEIKLYGLRGELLYQRRLILNEKITIPKMVSKEFVVINIRNVIRSESIKMFVN